MAAAAEAHLRKTLSRSKEVSSSPALANYLAKFTGTSQCSTEDMNAVARNNVTARLYNSKNVKVELEAVLTIIQRTFGGTARIDHQKHDRDGTAGRKTIMEHTPKSPIGRDSTSSELDGLAEANPSLSQEDDGDDMGMSTDGISGPGSANDHPQPWSRSPTARASASPNSEILPSYIRGTEGASHNEEIHESVSGASPSLSDVEPDVEKPPAASLRENRTTVGTMSTFLPSLTGGYWSGSESAEDLEEIQPRKNRRGQRARRQIWEKKYGRNANHLKMATEQDDWKPRRTIQDRDGLMAPERRKRMSGSRAHRTVLTSSGPGLTGKPELADKRPLHPSWEAARQAKERKKSAMFQGEKIVFD